MTKQRIVLSMLAMALTIGEVARCTAAGELMFGCWNRPTCGKVCRLVCEKKKLTVVGYGSKCETICVPGPSCRGCKHCSVECCGEGDDCTGGTSSRSCCHACQPVQAKIEFCWRDWFARGCAKPRTIKVLTKYQAEKEICGYHWEVVDAGNLHEEITTAGAAASSSRRVENVYKPAPADAQVGDVLSLSRADRTDLAAYFQIDQDPASAGLPGEASPAPPAADAVPLLQRPADMPERALGPVSLKDRAANLLSKQP
jgi:hypothetical protein